MVSVNVVEGIFKALSSLMIYLNVGSLEKGGNIEASREKRRGFCLIDAISHSYITEEIYPGVKVGH